MTKTTPNYSFHAVLVMLVLIGILLVMQAVVRYNDFVTHQQQLMENAVHIEAKEIARLVDELHNQVAIFAEEKYEIINFLAAYPDSEEISAHIRQKVSGLFPGYLDITISDENAVPRFNSGEKDSDIVCLADMVAYLDSGTRSDVSLHEYKGIYHFDIMSMWGRSRVRGIIRISFKPELLARSLQISEAAGHRLLLLHSGQPGLVEVTTQGARTFAGLEGDARLDTATLARIGASEDVPGTRWRLVALPRQNLYSEQLRFILVQTLSIMLAIGLVGWIMVRLIRRAERQRRRSEVKLLSATEHLQQALDFSDVFMCRWRIDTDALRWSANAGQLFGNALPATLQSYMQLVDETDHDALREAIEHCLASGEPYQHEHRLHLPHGGTYWIEASGNFEQNSDTGATEMISLVSDITERKQAEQQRLEAEQAQRDTLVREVHHRIKNHLQGVVGLLRQHTNKSPAIRGIIDAAVGQLYSVSTVYGLQSRDSRSKVELAELLKQICRTTQDMTGARIDCTQQDDPPNPAILSDDRAVAIALILNELMANAVKHAADADRAEVQVGLSIDAGTATISIDNTAAAVPADFDFAAGTGLGTGLSLIRSLLPGKGAQLAIAPRQGRMRAVLELCSPVIRKEV
ncbi:MAG: PAS domain-containing protein [Granulosicoccaceae bacterium]|jgi:PAS domain S-box-containing protein